MHGHRDARSGRGARGLRQGAAALLVGGLLVVGTVGGAILPAGAQGTPAAIASPVATGSIQLTGGVLHPGPVTVADLQAMPSETVTVSFKAGSGDQTHTFTGVRLAAVLDKAGLPQFNWHAHSARNLRSHALGSVTFVVVLRPTVRRNRNQAPLN